MVEGCTRMGCNWQHWEEVDVSGHKDFVELKIRDTGSGISNEDLPKIFEPFYSTKGQKGNGLGLAVIWGIIDNHNAGCKSLLDKVVMHDVPFLDDDFLVSRLVKCFNPRTFSYKQR